MFNNNNYSLFALTAVTNHSISWWYTATSTPVLSSFQAC